MPSSVGITPANALPYSSLVGIQGGVEVMQVRAVVDGDDILVVVVVAAAA